MLLHFFPNFAEIKLELCMKVKIWALKILFTNFHTTSHLGTEYYTCVMHSVMLKT
jgi:hypothetical protein